MYCNQKLVRQLRQQPEDRYAESLDQRFVSRAQLETF